MTHLYTVVTRTPSQMTGRSFVVSTRRFRDEAAARSYASAEATRTAQIWARYNHAVLIGGPVRGRTIAEYRSSQLGETRIVEFGVEA